MNKKLIYILFLLLMPFVFADMRTFPNTITIKTFNGTVNITTEQNSHVYDCMGNSTSLSSFTFDLQRNLSIEEDLRDVIDDLKENNKLCEKVSVLETAVSQYGDVNTYFKLYTQCNTDSAICNKDKTDYLTKNIELTPFKANYETCSKNLEVSNNQINQYSNVIIPSMQTNLTSMSYNLNQSEKGKWLWFFFGVGIMSIIMILKEKKRNPELQKHKMLGLSGGTQR